MAEQNNNSYPMISEKYWWAIRNKFRASVPTTVTPTYVTSLLSLGSDASANSNVIYPMKRMGLLDDENKPTALANDWRLDDKYGEACSVIIRNVYPTELLELFPNSTVDRNSAKNWFMRNGVGQVAANKMVALFILLKSGEIKEKEISQKKSVAATKGTRRQSSNVAASAQVTESLENKDLTPLNINSRAVRPNLHIDLQIHISPDSTPEQIETIFASMAKHFYGEDGK